MQSLRDIQDGAIISSMMRKIFPIAAQNCALSGTVAIGSRYRDDHWSDVSTDRSITAASPRFLLVRWEYLSRIWALLSITRRPARRHSVKRTFCRMFSEVFRAAEKNYNLTSNMPVRKKKQCSSAMRSYILDDFL